MSTLFLRERDPFDILFRNFFQDASRFLPLADSKLNYPVDIYQNEHGLVFEIACTGIAKEDIKIETQNNLLKVVYNRTDPDDDKKEYLVRNISKRSFDLGWRIDNKFDLNQAVARFENGLLTIGIPFSQRVETKLLEIK